jgi:methylisocitrate lyase
MARSDIRGIEDLPATIDRLKALVDAGADAVFPEALASLDEFAAVRAAIDVPILANMTEFGRSDLLPHAQLRDVGVNLVIHPVSLLRLAMGAVERGLTALRSEGTLAGLVPEMQTRTRLYEVLDYAGTAEFDEGVYTFDLSQNLSS